MKTYTLEKLGKVCATNDEWSPLTILLLDANITNMVAIIAEPVKENKWVKHKLKIRFSRKCGCYWYVLLYGRRLRSDHFIKVNVGE